MPLPRRSLAALLSFIIAFAPFRAAAQMVDVAAARGNSAGIFVAPGLAAGTITASSLSASALAPIPNPSLAAPSIALPSPASPAAAMALSAAPAAAASAPVEAKRSLIDAGGKLAAAKPADQGKALETVFSGAKGDAAIPGSQLADDKIIYRLWQLAKQSKSTRVKIGSMVVDRKGKIIGEDWNRASTPAERKLIGVGIILHAEQGALAQAWHKTKGKLEGARVYAMGISQDAKLYVRKINPGVACKICARSMERFRVSAMSYSSRGFKEFFWNEVLPLAKKSTAHRWWQSAHKDDPNVTWQPISEVEERLRKAAQPEIHPERTAMSRSRPSIPVRLAKRLLKGKILDYGAGRGKDTRYLKAAGLNIQAYDPFYFPNKPSKAEKLDWVILNYVLNVVRTPEERAEVLRDVSGLLKPGGRLLVSVRGDDEIEESRNKGWKRDGDGWITPHRTFQHGYSQAELESRLQEAGFKVVQILSPLIVVAEKAGPKRGTGFGKQTPQAVYYHRSLEKQAPPRLAALVARAKKLLPGNARWNLIKVDNHGESVSFLWYPDFDSDAHPALRYVYRVDLKSRKTTATDHASRENPFILHRKDSMVGAEYPLYAKFRAVTMKEESAGLLNRSDIGTRGGWEAALKTAKRP
ncbi:MAG: methyltransferase domain-containing protein [Elusimicrobiota bacterium]